VRFVFDLDGTICTQERDYNDARPIASVVEHIRRLHAEGHFIEIFTARGSGTGINWSELTRAQLEEWGVPYNVQHDGKPAADFYVDDRAVPVRNLERRRALIVAEIGINHNGSLATALDLIEAAADAGADYVKFQKRTPRVAVPRSEWAKTRETPWGVMSYIEYKERIEFGAAEYDAIDAFCRENDIGWFASPWDVEALDFLRSYNLPMLKIASASITDEDLLREAAAAGIPLVMSSGMSTLDEVRHAVELLGPSLTTICHCNSSYPCPPEDLNLTVIDTLRREFPGYEIGYSGHEVGLSTTVAAVALGASFIERHITLDRSMWGTDQAASVEPQGFARLVRDIRVVEAALGDGVKRVTAGELPARERLRGITA